MAANRRTLSVAVFRPADRWILEMAALRGTGLSKSERRIFNDASSLYSMTPICGPFCEMSYSVTLFFTKDLSCSNWLSVMLSEPSKANIMSTNSGSSANKE